jgi:two-component system response regulator (stage 0 sporulation protein A)
MSLVSARGPTDRKERVTPELVRILRKCCISPRHRGYACIFESVELMFYQEDSDQPLTKKIYPNVAKKQGTTAVRVEKNIRDAIRGGWEKGGREAMSDILGCGREKPPTNGEFISCACEKMLEMVYDGDRRQRPPEYK